MNRKSLQEKFAQLKGHVGLFCENLITGECIEINANDRFKAASIIKLPIYMCISKWVQEGKADYYERIKVHNRDKLPINGALTLFTDEPFVDILTLCKLMISLSDNSATNILIDRFGISAFNEEFQKIGIKKTQLNRYLFDEKASSCGVENYIVLSEIGTLLKKIYEKSFVDERTSKDVEDTLLLQQFNHMIPGRIGDGTVPIAHKTGEDTGIANDIGIVYAKQPFIICIAGNDTDVAEFQEVIRNVSYELFKQYNQ